MSPVLVTPTIGSNPSGNDNSDSSRHLGPIIGGVVGGVAGLCALIFLVWFFIRKRQRWDDIFDNDDVPVVAASANRKEKLVDSGPRPYHYGIVGHTKTPSLTSPPSSPPPSSAPTLLDSGIDRSHYRNSSTTPLLIPAMGGMTHGPGASVSPRPPSQGSALGYGSQFDANPRIQGQGWDPSGLYNAPSQPRPLLPGPPTMGAVGPMAAMIGRSDGGNRTGSPVSFQEQRILQVANTDLHPQSPQSPEISSSLSGGRLSVDPQRDGKGRIAPKGEKAPIVHLDGGRYQEGVAGSSSAAAPGPPAYSE